jgi:hypothetical protein
MQLSDVRRYAMALPEVTEQPHHQSTSFRVRGKIFITVPPKGDCVHIFVDETPREQAIALYPSFVKKLFWGGKVWGIRVILGAAKSPVVKSFIRSAWAIKAPKTLAAHYRASKDGGA